jgi:hypothetical protein
MAVAFGALAGAFLAEAVFRPASVEAAPIVRTCVITEHAAMLREAKLEPLFTIHSNRGNEHTEAALLVLLNEPVC